MGFARTAIDGEETAQVVQQVMPPISAVMPDPQVVDMDMGGSAPATTMGPGQPATEEEMPEIFAETEEQRQQEQKQREVDEVE